MNVEGMDKLFKKLTELGADVQEVLFESVDKNMHFIQGQSKMLCPVDKGQLRNSIVCDVVSSGNGVQGVCTTNVEYAAYVEFGTGPVGEENHQGISPNVDVSYRSKGWAYVGEDGEFVYTKGQAAQPFLYPALKDNEKYVVKEVKKDLTNEIRRLCND